MSEPKPVRVGVLGLGFMGQTHVRAYAAAHADGAACPLVAVCDRSADRLAGRVSSEGNLESAGDSGERLFDPATLSAYDDLDAFFADESIDLVSICTPTDSHVPLATRAMDAGKHVLLEKPVALRSADVDELRAVQRSSGRLCQPAMCIRFWPGGVWRLSAGRDGRFGAWRALSIQRLGGAPGWGDGFYADESRSGGALFDLHVHDSDFVLWLLGQPDAVRAQGDASHVSTQYVYEQGPSLVQAEGGWLPGGAFPFRMRYVAAFEHATAEFDSMASAPLTLTRESQHEPVPSEAGTGYDFQARAAVEAVRRNDASGTPTLDDAYNVTRVLEAERESQTRGRAVTVTGS